jgi:hypothetical protein
MVYLRKALLVRHAAKCQLDRHDRLDGRLVTAVSWFRTGSVFRLDDGRSAVTVGWILRGHRNANWMRVDEGEPLYVTLETEDGEVLWDSRTLIPCEIAV